MIEDFVVEAYCKGIDRGIMSVDGCRNKNKVDEMDNVKDLPVRKMREYKCTNCGAPMERSFGDTIYCDYCGSVYVDNGYLRVLHVPKNLERLKIAFNVPDYFVESASPESVKRWVQNRIGEEVAKRVAPRIEFATEEPFGGSYYRVSAEIGVCFLGQEGD